MIEQYLIQDLAEFLRKILEHERLETPVEITKDARATGSLFESSSDQHELQSELLPITVYEGFIPPRATLESDRPFVCVRPASGSVENGRTELTVIITVGVYAEDLKGYHDALHAYRHIVTELTSLKCNRLNDKYERSTQMSWRWLQDRDDNYREDPYWAVDIETTWWLYTNYEKEDEWL